MTRSISLGVGVLLVCLVADGRPALLAQQPTFRISARTVAVYATVQDANGTLVPDLSRDDFEVFEDGARRDIVQFSSDPQPLSVVVMLDTGNSSLNSPAERLRTRTAVTAFLDALRPEDRARIGTFGLQIALGAHLTNDRAELRRVLDEEVWNGGGTPLWQALIAAMQSLAQQPGRRVVLALTDGADTGRLPGFIGGRSNVDDRVVRDECMVYAVRFAGISGLPNDIKDVAGASGGGHFVVPPGADLEATFMRIAEELRHQYLIGFVPEAADGLTHRVDVRAVRPGLTVRARQTFIAGAE